MPARAQLRGDADRPFGKTRWIETSRGTLTADKVIVTVPTNLIADEAIRFHPPLPAKVDAARGLPPGSPTR